MSDRIAWRKPKVNEALAALYLRLNGYFTTGLVIHSPEWGNSRTEIDCLAVRHPHHAQPDRGVGLSRFLARPDQSPDGRIDILICEVKSVPADVAFNSNLWTEPDVLELVLQWVGVLDPQEIYGIAEQLRPILGEGLAATHADDGVCTDTVRVRGLLCCPPAEDDDLPGWWLSGHEILRYAHACFNPPERRDACSTRYNFDLWGLGLSDLVRYLKGLRAEDVPSLDGLYAYLGAVLQLSDRMQAGLHCQG